MSTNKETRRLLDLEINLSGKLKEKIQQAREIEEAAAGKSLERVLAGSELTTEDTENVLRAKVEARHSEVVIKKIRDARQVALLGIHRRAADELTSQAKSKEHEAGRLRAQVDEVLRKLSGLEEVQFDRSIVMAQRCGGWLTNVFCGDRNPEDCNPRELSPDLDGSFAIPKSRRLADEAKSLLQQAAGEREYEVQRAGSETAESLEELLARLAADPDRIWPALFEIEQWADAALEKAKKSLGALFEHSQFTFKLVWKNGVIEARESHIERIGGNRANALGSEKYFAVA